MESCESFMRSRARGYSPALAVHAVVRRPRPRELSINWHETIASATRLLAHISVALHLRRSHARHRAPALHFDFQPQLIARAHRPAKLGALDSGKHHDFVAAVFDFGQQQRAAGLRDGFHNQHSRHDGQPGKVSREKRFVDGHVLDGDDALFALQIKHAVDQQERDSGAAESSESRGCRARSSSSRAKDPAQGCSHSCSSQTA